MSAYFQERRAHPRFNSRIPMRYRKIGTETREFKGALLQDISKGGVRLQSYEFLPLNAKLSMEMSLSYGKSPIQGICRVAWVTKTPFSDQYVAGLHFERLNEGAQTEITEFMRTNTL